MSKAVVTDPFDLSGLPEGKDASETKHQLQVIKWSQMPQVRQLWPELRLLYHVPNERDCSDVTRHLLKLMGVKPGVADLVLPVARGNWHGLYLELKKFGGRPSANQLWWKEQLTAQNYRAVTCYGWKQACAVLMEYMRAGDYDHKRD